MPAYARSEIVCESEVEMFHVFTRCVRRAFLCGADPVTGQDYEHRKQWVEQRLQELSASMALDICGFAVMSNHLHVVVRTRPDVAASWADEEVARRWWQLFPRRRDASGAAAEPQEHELRMLTADSRALAERRRRLSSLSWFMRCLCEPIARRANREDEVSGRFFEGRFKCQKLLDEAAILACSVYVDLNPVRAGLADLPEEAAHTSAYARIRGEQARQLAAGPLNRSRVRRRRSPSTPFGADADGWLCPVPFEGDPADLASANTRRRASNKGFLPLQLADYLRILDWTGRQLRDGSLGSIPSDVQPILERIGVSSEFWFETVTHFGRLFHRAAGRVSLLVEAASRARKHWFQGIGSAQHAFV